jgi:phosphinothricin acetyltransferase
MRITAPASIDGARDRTHGGPPRFTIRDARDVDLPAILAITNHEVLHTTAVWTLTPVTLESRIAWLRERQAAGFPVLVAASDDDRVLGFASYGKFRAWEGYRLTVEGSVYVERHVRRRGIGTALLVALIRAARDQGLHAMIAGIEAGNLASIALHARLGFREVGRLPAVGRKFDRWLDLVLMQLILPTSG